MLPRGYADALSEFLDLSLVRRGSAETAPALPKRGVAKESREQKITLFVDLDFETTDL